MKSYSDFDNSFNSGIIYAPYIPIYFGRGRTNMVHIKVDREMLKIVVTFSYEEEDGKKQVSISKNGIKNDQFITSKEMHTREEARSVWEDLVKMGFKVDGH